MADAPATDTAPVEVAPSSLTVTALEIETAVTETGLNPDGTLEVPPVTRPGRVTWWSGSVPAGDRGPSVLLGHASGRPAGATESVPGVFADLDTLEPGDEIRVERSDDRVAVFAVETVESYDKVDFPHARVYGDRDGPELVMITCGGVFDPAARSYEQNLVVYAELTDLL